MGQTNITKILEILFLISEKKEGKMDLVQLLERINHHRETQGLSRISIETRPSRSAPGKRTIEVMGNGDVLKKSISGGAIHFYLAGMLQAYQDAPVIVSGFNKGLSEGGQYIRHVTY